MTLRTLQMHGIKPSSGNSTTTTTASNLEKETGRTEELVENDPKP